MRKHSITRDVRNSLALLSVSSRWKLALLVIANIFSSIADLLGVALIGLLSLFLVSSNSDSSTESPLIQVFNSYFDTSQIPVSQVVFGLALAAALFFLLKSVTGTILSRRTLLFLAHRQSEVGMSMLKSLFKMPLITIEERSSQETVYALTRGVSSAIVGLLGATALGIAEISLLLILFSALVYVNLFVTLIATVFFIAIAIFMHFFLGNWARKTGYELSEARFSLMQSIQEGISSYRELKVGDKMSNYIEQQHDLVWVEAKSTATGLFIAQAPKYVYESALLFGALGLGAWAFNSQSQADAIATLAIFMAAGSRIMPSMLRLQNALVSIRACSGEAEPTFALFSQYGDIEGKDSSLHLAHSGNFCPEIKLRNVTARYPHAAEPALIDVTLDIASGSTVALVGPTGAGKSTLVDAVLGILPLEHGEVAISNRPPEQAISDFPGLISYVPQVVSLVSGSVRSNIALGFVPEEIDDDKIWQVLEDVHLASYLKVKRDSLDTIIGENGVKLSGGQRQRLGLARALYTNPRVLVLDEATSALDAETEAAISQTLEKLHGTVTNLIVAHRLATIRASDQIIYMEQGRILATGSFDEVRKTVRRFDHSAKLLGL